MAAIRNRNRVTGASMIKIVPCQENGRIRRKMSTSKNDTVLKRRAAKNDRIRIRDTNTPVEEKCSVLMGRDILFYLRGVRTVFNSKVGGNN